MSKPTDQRIGLRVPVPIKERWQELADQEHRTLSNWIIHKIESERADSEATPRPRKSRTS